MSVTSGFFNSVDYDREYDATQFSSIFDGIINDGVYASQGNTFAVAPGSSGMEISVNTGRAWFNHAWILNDSLYTLTLETSEVVYDRIDAVVIEVDHRELYRRGSIKIIKGTPASTPEKPTMKQADNVYQYPLAYITVGAGVASITSDKIENAVGTDACPFVNGIIDRFSVEQMLSKYELELQKYMSSFELSAQKEFEAWFADLQTELDGDIAANLQNQINDVAEKEFNMYYDLEGRTTNINRYGTTITETVPNVMTATTTINRGDSETTIRTDIIPKTGIYKYRKKYVIGTSYYSGTTITESYIRVGINDSFPSNF